MEQSSRAEVERHEMEADVNSDQFTVQTICDLAEVECIREVWKTWQKSRDSNIDFFSGIVRSRGNGCRPHILVLRRNGEAEALLVGLRHHTKFPIRISSRTVLKPEVTALEFTLGGLLGNASSQNCEALVQALMTSLAEGDADLVFWDQLDPQSHLYTHAIQRPGVLRRDHCRKLYDHWFQNLPDGLEAFLLTLRHSQRSKLRRKYKKFVSTFAGRIEIRCFQTAEEVGQAIREMEEIACKSIKRRLGFGFFNTLQSREQLLVEAIHGWLKIFVLYIDGVPVSFWKGTLYEHCLYADHVGFDASWSEHSPGIFLFLNVVESLRDSDVNTLDFGTGCGQFYDSFARVRRSEARVHIYAPTLNALQLSLLYTLAHHATLLVNRTSSLNWARRAIWKARKSALERTPPKPSSPSAEPSNAIL